MDKHHRAHLTERAFRAAGWVWTSSSTDSQHALLSPITPRLVKADELYVYIEPGGVRVGLEVVSRYFSLSATSLTATTHSSLLFNYLLLIRDEGVQAWVKRYKTPRNRAENLLLWKPSPHFISFFPPPSSFCSRHWQNYNRSRLFFGAVVENMLPLSGKTWAKTAQMSKLRTAAFALTWNFKCFAEMHCANRSLFFGRYGKHHTSRRETKRDTKTLM